MGVFDFNPVQSTDDPYQPVLIPQLPGQGYLDTLSNQQKNQERPLSSFKQDLNDGLEKSNLLGPSNPDDPQSEALSQRARQIYGSQINQVTRSSTPMAVNRQMNLNTQNVQNRAALYQNMQSRAANIWEQASYVRQSALTKAIMEENQALDIFGGASATAGAAAGGLFWSKNKAPDEQSAPRPYGYSPPPPPGYGYGGP